MSGPLVALLALGCAPRHSYPDGSGLEGQLEREVIALNARIRTLREQVANCGHDGAADPLYVELIQVFAGTDWGLYFTDDIEVESPTWVRFTEGLPSVMIWDMAIDRGFTTLALFTRSRGAFVWPLPQTLEHLFSDGFEE